MAEVEETAPTATNNNNDGTDGAGEADSTPTDLEKKIIRQVEYYFGDINLSRDKFLQEKIKENEGWITLDTMIMFNRLKSLSSDKTEICTALRKSTSEILEVSEDGEKLRRSQSKPLPENTQERKTDLHARSVYAKGFPLDSTLDDLQEYFNDHGDIEYIQMRKNPKKDFKGSVFVIFTKKDDAEKFIKTEDLKYQETVLTKSSKDDYFKRKNEERHQQKQDREKTKEENQKKRDNIEVQNLKDKITPGTILHLIGVSDDTSLEDIRNFFSDFSKVAWVDYEKGSKEAWVRFDAANPAKEVVDKVKEGSEGKMELNGATLDWDVLEGEAELNHWKQIFKDQAENWTRKNQQRNQKRGWKSFKGKPYHRKGRRDSDKPEGGSAGADNDHEDEPPVKVKKLEENVE